jgi:hypothetical protein
MPIWVIALIAVVAIFTLGGYTWQALDEHEFPDSHLPRWFVRIFRRRSK